MPHHGPWSSPLPAAAAAALIVSALSAAGVAELPELTEAGDWNGSWIYNSRNIQIALYMRGRADRPEVKVAYRNLDTAQQFESDWNGQAFYSVAGDPASFALRLTRRDRSRLQGTWNHEYPWRGVRRAEHASVTMFRTEDGRSLVMVLDDRVRARSGPEGETRQQIERGVWTMRKASRRVVRWEELPF
jgi:hypothetical protein